jgi:hypothetical protein
LVEEIPVNSSYPASDFLRKVEVWQQAPGGTAGVAVPMAENEEMTLDQLLASIRRDGASARLEAQARYWLIGYREQDPPLTGAQARELDTVIAGAPVGPSWRALADSEPARRRQYAWVFPSLGRSVRVTLGVAAIACLALIIVFAVIIRTGSGSNGNAPAGNSQQVPAQQQVPVNTTDLQQFETDWGPFTQLPVSAADPASGAPAVILLNQGGYYVSRWYLGSNTHSGPWTLDNENRVTARTVQGDYVIFTDGDGQQWVVGTDQPFVLATDPSTVIYISGSGDIWTMPVTEAIIIRTHSKTSSRT